MATKLLQKIANKQFEIYGSTLTFADIPEDELVEVDKKKKYWWEVYKFTEEQEKLWKTWALDQLKGNALEMKGLDFVELRYGFSLNYKKGKS